MDGLGGGGDVLLDLARRGISGEVKRGVVVWHAAVVVAAGRRDVEASLLLWKPLKRAPMDQVLRFIWPQEAGTREHALVLTLHENVLVMCGSRNGTARSRVE